MKKAIEEKKNLAEYSIIEAIFECGRLKMSIEDIVYLLSQRADKQNLEHALQNPESEEYQALLRGRAEGNFDRLSALNQAATLGYQDSYNALSDAQKHAAISQKIKENFGIE